MTGKVDREGVYAWPWCFGHNTPMLSDSEKGFFCHLADTPTRDGSDGCQATTIHFRYVGFPYDLSIHPAWVQ